ncbi:IclR family transcriptional regulator [Pseudomaricurvus sp. HS19]|uniref:IclR family transcriptional regulator n=1 Tax=Pseudomaricurvus sp. HS19 TaxID=2692626 RepID=UPI0013691739|nr:IclR family transcriptional regulator [Pseudomaricurvus sp. HS19]MYM62397.1 helix-turn-helix domain-containing protein [Pseudomaricurvus sp. HS19]
MKIVKSAARTLQLFSLFAEERRPLTLSELGAGVGAPPSSCHELVQTLIELGFLLVLDDGKRYYPSRRLLNTANRINEFNPIKEKVHLELRRIRDATGESIVVGMLEGKEVVYMDVFEGSHTIRYNASVGDLKPLHASALGKALLASLQPAARERLIKALPLTRFTDRTLTRIRDLENSIKQGLSDGYFVSRGERNSDVMGIAIPMELRGKTLAIGIIGPLGRIERNLDSYVQALRLVIERLKSN